MGYSLPVRRASKIIFLSVLVISLTLALIWGLRISSNTTNNQAMIPLDEFGAAPDFSLPDLEGNILTLSSLKDHIVLVNFWGTWCQSCCDEMPGLDTVYRKYSKKGLEIVAVAVEFSKTPETQLLEVKKKIQELDVTFTVVMGHDEVVEAFGGKTENFPQTFLIDRNGHIRKKIVGAREQNFWEALVRSVLSAK